MKSTVGQDAIDDAEVIQHFERARLQTFAAGAIEVLGRFIDDADADVAASELTGERETGGAASDDENGKFGGCLGAWS